VKSVIYLKYEEPLMILSINSGHWGVTVVYIVIDTKVIKNMALEKWAEGEGTREREGLRCGGYTMKGPNVHKGVVRSLGRRVLLLERGRMG
jgi:hypothetical protein